MHIDYHDILIIIYKYRIPLINLIPDYCNNIMFIINFNKKYIYKKDM